MSAVTKVYHCKACGFESTTMLLRCPNCRHYERFNEGRGHTKGMVRDLIQVSDLTFTHIPTTPELDEALGGGIVRGAVYLFGGDPGIGKSTLILQLLSLLSTEDDKGFYVSAEEADGHVKKRGTRLNIKMDHIRIVEETNAEKIEKILEKENPAWTAIDSISMLHTEGHLTGSAQGQKDIISRLYQLAHAKGMTLFIISHMTKDGDVAGPKALEHAVDARFDFEGERKDKLRVLRSIKNRLGPTPRMGLFEMTPTGIIDVQDPGLALFENRTPTAGSVLSVAWEDGRPFIVEVQTLIGPKNPGNPRRTVSGVTRDRVALIMAVLQRYVGGHCFGLSESDIYISIVGGIKLDDTALDLPIALSICSALMGKPVNEKIAFVGELGLLGEIHSGLRIEDRQRLAERMGFELRTSNKLQTIIESEIR